jgi:thioredoxin-like negative regulator of GroEL
VQQAPELARRFAVAAIPASVLVKEGRVAKVLVGGGSAKKLKALLQA